MGLPDSQVDSILDGAGRLIPSPARVNTAGRNYRRDSSPLFERSLHGEFCWDVYRPSDLASHFHR
jgi:hypothetical protein